MPLFWIAFLFFGIPISAIGLLVGFGDVLLPEGNEDKDGFRKQ